MEMREKLIDVSDSRTSQKAIKSRLENLPKDLKRRILERNDDAIIDYIESQSSQSSDTNENFKVNHCPFMFSTVHHLSSFSR